MVLNLEMALDDMVEKLRMLPEHVFDKLESAVRMVSSKREFWSSKVLFRSVCISFLLETIEIISFGISFGRYLTAFFRNVHEGTFRSSMDPPAQPETSETSSNCLLATGTDEPKDSIALRTRRQTRLSQAYAHQVVIEIVNSKPFLVALTRAPGCGPEWRRLTKNSRPLFKTNHLSLFRGLSGKQAVGSLSS